MNALVISDIPATIPGLDRLIAQLDRKTQEVEIEARIVAATRTFVREIGVQLGGGWGGASTSVSGNPNAGIRQHRTDECARERRSPSAPFPLSAAASCRCSRTSRCLQPTSGFEILNAGHSYALDLVPERLRNSADC